MVSYTYILPSIKGVNNVVESASIFKCVIVKQKYVEIIKIETKEIDILFQLSYNKLNDFRIIPRLGGREYGLKQCVYV